LRTSLDIENYQTQTAHSKCPIQ